MTLLHMGKAIPLRQGAKATQKQDSGRAGHLVQTNFDATDRQRLEARNRRWLGSVLLMAL